MTGYIQIEDTNEIARLNRRLCARLRHELFHAETRTIGTPQGNSRRKVRFLSDTGDNVFYATTRSSKDRSTAIILFGHGAPHTRNSLSIDVQFNLPVIRFSRKKGGAFLRDVSTNSIVLAHRGIVNLGRGHIAKDDLFSEMYTTVREAETSKGADKFLLIGGLESQTLINDIDAFSSELRRAAKVIKGTVLSARDGPMKNSTTLTSKLRKSYDEFSGVRRRGSQRESVADCYHGTVIRAIRDAFGEADEVLKNQAIDLTIVMGKRVYLFEAKTSSNPQSIYTAIGQLTTHAQVVTEYAPRKTLVRVMVLPERPNQRFCSLFKDQLGIRLMTFTRDPQGRVTLNGLEQLK